MTLEQWLANPRARGVKAFWTGTESGPTCNVTIAYSGSLEEGDESVFYATGTGRSPEVACANAFRAAETDPYGKWNL